MSDVKGLTVDSPFVDLVGDPPISTLLEYVHETWLEYANTYKNLAPSFQKRREPQLTQALAAHLRVRQDAGQQPISGDFFGELAEYVLDSSGLPKCIARTDIEWRLYGVVSFVVEFKVLDGKKTRRDKYLQDGVMRFVVGRYASKASNGAMFGLLREKAGKDPALILAEMNASLAGLQCAGTMNISGASPQVAGFDSDHSRHAPHVTPFRLVHIFVGLPT
jgi:hypothetical protein